MNMLFLKKVQREGVSIVVFHWDVTASVGNEGNLYVEASIFIVKRISFWTQLR